MDATRREDKHADSELLADSEPTNSRRPSTLEPAAEDKDSIQALSRRIDELQMRVVRVQRRQMEQAIALRSLCSAISNDTFAHARELPELSTHQTVNADIRAPEAHDFPWEGLPQQTID